ncbi:Protein kinase domain-containing protein [Mycena venus]|uniref:Protein kinase domain-containing protein n=1 Tax=Mycena venus TaxID=2733690 RepID=A0A8H7CP83_9AGAR|nr:Protein kinase domain-containing protein [Mycena venus]
MEAEPGTRVNSTSSPPEILTDLPAENKDIGLSSIVLPENCDDNLAGQLTWTQGPWFDTHRNLASYVLQTVRPSLKPELVRLSKQWAQWDILTCLANYRSVMKILLGYLEDQDFPDSNVVATNISDHLSRDISLVFGQITSVLLDSQNYKCFLACSGSLAQRLLDLIQDLLDLSYQSSYKPLLWKALLRLSRKSGLHPTCFTLSRVEKVGQQMAGGGFGDIWRGLVDGQTVAVKSIRIFLEEDVQTALKEFGREALIWRQLSHPNLLPFFGLYTLDGRLSLVSPWMENGHLQQYLKGCPRDMDRLPLILDVAMGLEYLHKNHIVHGDLKSPNVLVTPSERACIADFGMSSIDDVMSLKITHTTRSILGGTARYQAPELLEGASLNHFGSDVYAFACIGFEILTGAPPFSELANEMAVGIKVIAGKRPSRPQAIISDALWALLDHCWQQEQVERPTMLQVVESLKSCPISATVKQFGRDWDETYSAKFRRSVQPWPLLPTKTQIEREIIHGFDFFDHRQPTEGFVNDPMASDHQTGSDRGGRPDRRICHEISSQDQISFPPEPMPVIPADQPSISMLQPLPTYPRSFLDPGQSGIVTHQSMMGSQGSTRVAVKSKSWSTVVLSKMKSWWTKGKSSQGPTTIHTTGTIHTRTGSAHSLPHVSGYTSPVHTMSPPLPAQVSNREDIIEPFVLRSTSPPVSMPPSMARKTSETTLLSTVNSHETPAAIMVLERYDAPEASELPQLTPSEYVLCDSCASPTSSPRPGDPTRHEKILVDTQRLYNSRTRHGGEDLPALSEVIGRMRSMSPASRRPRLNPPAYSPYAYASSASSPKPGDSRSPSPGGFALGRRTRREKASVDVQAERIAAINEVIGRMGLMMSPDSDSESVVGSTISPHTDSTGQSRLSSPPVLTTRNGL